MDDFPKHSVHMIQRKPLQCMLMLDLQLLKEQSSPKMAFGLFDIIIRMYGILINWSTRIIRALPPVSV